MSFSASWAARCAMGLNEYGEIYTFDDGAMPTYELPQLPGRPVPFWGLQDVTKIELPPGISNEELLVLCRQRCRSDHFVLIDAYNEIPDTFMLGAAMSAEHGGEVTHGFAFTERSLRGKAGMSPSMVSASDLNKAIAAFAATVSAQPLGLAKHCPETWGQQTRCFANVGRKVKQDGGRGRSGWMFQHRYLAEDVSLGYLLAIHHAVWQAPTGHLIDVTPFHDDPKHHPLCPGDGVLFLVDDGAQPVITDRVMAPLPSRFFALSAQPRLVEHVKRLDEEERRACQLIYGKGITG